MFLNTLNLLNHRCSHDIKYNIFVFFFFRIMETSKNFVKLQKEELNIAEIIELVTFPNCGAISNFIGITRDNFENKKVSSKKKKTLQVILKFKYIFYI